MYDTVLSSEEVNVRLLRLAHTRASMMVKVDPVLVECMGGEEKILRRILRTTDSAKDALAISPRERLAHSVGHWILILQENIRNPKYDPIEVEQGDPEFERLVDQYLLTRLEEIDAALKKNDVTEAFRLFRKIDETREGEIYEAIIPESLDATSHYWVDIDQDN